MTLAVLLKRRKCSLYIFSRPRRGSGKIALMFMSKYLLQLGMLVNLVKDIVCLYGHLGIMLGCISYKYLLR